MPVQPIMPEQQKILFTGRVQGVGFRYTTDRFAQGYSVTGYVRNLDDGRVELVAEGLPAEIDGLLAEIRAHFADPIQHQQLDRRPATGQYAAFEIRR